MKGGFKESPIRLNGGLGLLENWNEDAIKARAEKLADLGLTVWPTPKLAAEVLATYRPTPTEGTSYTIADHPNLLTPGIRELFEAFRKEVLALDPCVTEEFLKYYIAYKAETNFVDVIPQQKKLRLSLNMYFPDINDPKGLCRDISAIGRWGNGDVDVGLASLDELPYVMGLVRQSLERQLGEPEQR